MKNSFLFLFLLFCFSGVAQKTEYPTISIISERGLQLSIQMEATPVLDDMFVFKVKSFKITGLYPTDSQFQTAYTGDDLGKYGINFPLDCTGCYFSLKGGIVFRGISYPFVEGHVMTGFNSQIQVDLPESLDQEITAVEWKAEASNNQALLQAYNFRGVKITEIFEALEKFREDAKEERLKDEFIVKADNASDNEEKIDHLEAARKLAESQPEREKIDQRISTLQNEIEKEKVEKLAQEKAAFVENTANKADVQSTTQEAVKVASMNYYEDRRYQSSKRDLDETNAAIQRQAAISRQNERIEQEVAEEVVQQVGQGIKRMAEVYNHYADQRKAKKERAQEIARQDAIRDAAFKEKSEAVKNRLINEQRDFLSNFRSKLTYSTEVGTLGSMAVGSGIGDQKEIYLLPIQLRIPGLDNFNMQNYRDGFYETRVQTTSSPLVYQLDGRIQEVAPFIERNFLESLEDECHQCTPDYYLLAATSPEQLFAFVESISAGFDVYPRAFAPHEEDEIIENFNEWHKAYLRFEPVDVAEMNAEKVLARYVEAIGGQEALDKVENYMTKYKYYLEGDLYSHNKTLQTKDGKFYENMVSGPDDEVIIKWNGKSGFFESTVIGEDGVDYGRYIEYDENTDFRRPMFHLPHSSETTSLEGQEVIKGEKVYKIMTGVLPRTTSQRNVCYFYSAYTGLLVRKTWVYRDKLSAGFQEVEADLDRTVARYEKLVSEYHKNSDSLSEEDKYDKKNELLVLEKAIGTYRQYLKAGDIEKEILVHEYEAFREVDGIKFPFKIVAKVDGTENSSTVFSHISLNEKVTHADFN